MAKKKKTVEKLPLSREEVERILKGTDWNDYWRQVGEAAAPEIDAYERAMVKSRERSGHRVLLSTAVP